ncbi:MAG: hypothetical protein M1152_02785 [Actinobacteria bacterium]|nr:hypothetical protein [Actinomycetota bacterium]
MFPAKGFAQNGAVGGETGTASSPLQTQSQTGSLSAALSNTVATLYSKMSGVGASTLSEESKSLYNALPSLPTSGDPSGWSLSSFPPNTVITDTTCVSSVCFASGEEQSSSATSAGDFFISTNQGSSWSVTDLPQNPQTLGVSCTSSSDCTVLGVVPATTSSGTITQTPYLYITSDSGSTWTYNPLPQGVQVETSSGPLVQFVCVSLTECVIPAINGSSYELLLTQNQGLTYTDIPLLTTLLSITSLSCPSANECLVSGTEPSFLSSSPPVPLIIQVSNLGSSPSISVQSNFSLPSAYDTTVDTNLFPLSMLFIAFGEVLLSAETHIEGQVTSLGPLTDMSCPTSSVCYALGQANYSFSMSWLFSSSPISFSLSGMYILKSTDGGTTWSYQTSVLSQMTNSLPTTFVGFVASEFFTSSSSASSLPPFIALIGESFLGLAGSPGTISCVSVDQCYVTTLPNQSVFQGLASSGASGSTEPPPSVLADTILETENSGTSWNVQLSLETAGSLSNQCGTKCAFENHENH